MAHNGEEFLKEIFSIMNTKVLLCKCRKVKSSWRADNLRRGFSKLYFFTQGSGTVIINGERFEPRANTLMIIPEGTPHSFCTEEGREYFQYYCHFKAEANNISIFRMMDMDKLIYPSQPDVIKQRFDEMIDAFDKNTVTSPLRIKVCLIDMLERYFNEAHVRERPSESSVMRNMAETVRYINEHLQDKLDNKILADNIHLHPNYFGAIFKSVFASSPGQFIMEKRIERAKRLLEEEDMKIGQIASVVGYENVYYFSTSFKKYTDMSPTEYRNKFKGE